MKKFIVTDTSGQELPILGDYVVCVSNMFMVNQIPGDYCGHGLYVIMYGEPGRSSVAAFFPKGSWERWRAEDPPVSAEVRPLSRGDRSPW